MKPKTKAIMGALLKTVLPLIVGLAVLVVVIAALAGFFNKKISPGEEEVSLDLLPKDAITDIVHPIEQPYYEESIGTLKAATRTEVSSRIMAQIFEIKVRAGQEVKEGDVLIVLDDEQLRDSRGEAESALVAAIAAEQQAVIDRDRSESLFAKNAGSKADLDARRTALDVARANRERAERALAQANTVLSYATIVAPQSGRIIEQLAKEGSMAVPGVPLMTMYDRGSLRLEVPVREELIAQLAIGDVLPVYIDAREREVEAVVDEIVPQAEAASRSLLVKLKLPRSEDLFEGLFGRVKILAGQRRYLCLATAAVQRVGQLEFAYVVGPGDVLQRRQIRTGRVGQPGRVEVLSGLAAGERVWLISPEGAAKPTTTETESES